MSLSTARQDDRVNAIKHIFLSTTFMHVQDTAAAGGDVIEERTPQWFHTLSFL